MLGRHALFIAVLVAVWASVALVDGAGAQSPTASPSPTATITPGTIPAPTGLRTEGRMLTNPPTGPLRQFVIWNAIPDATASYQLERSLTDNTATRNFQQLATVAADARKPDGTFEYDAGAGFPNARFICYRVRAVVGSTVGPYSAETCIGPIPTTGGGAETPTAAAPSLHYALGSSPDSYVISGSGFEPGSVVRLIELPCSDLPCPSGGLAETDGIPVSAQGTFSALLQASPGYNPSDGRDYRLIVATPSGVPWDQSSPSIRVPLHHQGSPGAPSVGNGLATAGNVGTTAASVSLALAGLAVFGASVTPFRMRRGR